MYIPLHTNSYRNYESRWYREGKKLHKSTESLRDGASPMYHSLPILHTEVMKRKKNQTVNVMFVFLQKTENPLSTYMVRYLLIRLSFTQLQQTHLRKRLDNYIQSTSYH